MRFLLGIFLILAGCATDSGIVETGPDSYLISKRGGTAFSSVGIMKTDSIKEGVAFCKKVGKSFQLMNTQDVPGGPGRFPTSDVQFMCLSEGDSRLTGGALVPTAPVQINKTMGP